MAGESGNWFVYVLVSGRPAGRASGGGRTYVGISRDPERRLAQHNGERPGGARATRAGRPWRLAAVHGPYPERGGALRAELELKRLRGARRLGWRPAAGGR